MEKGQKMGQFLGKYIPCKICGISVYKKPSQIKKHKSFYCSRKCQNKSMEFPKVKKICHRCYKEYEIIPSQEKWNKIRKFKFNFCSIPCRKKWYFGENNTNGITGKFIEKRGYILVHAPTDYPITMKNGLMYEHRKIMAEKIGRPLKRNEDVHHINGNKSDNRIENLALLSRKEHMMIHRHK